MTSQKSLKNNVNLNDFKRSLLNSVIFPAIAFIVLFTTTTMPAIDFFGKEIFNLKVPYVHFFFSSSTIFYGNFNLAASGMTLCGMMTAVKLFRFMLSKKQVNVNFSLGVKRTTMFINRTVAGALTLFLSVFGPFVIIYIMNIAYFGISRQLTSIFLYIVFSLFISAMLGFAIALFAVTVSGGIVETIMTIGSVSFLPTLIFYGFICMTDALLRGCVTIESLSKYAVIINPFSFITNIESGSTTVLPAGSEVIDVNDLVKPFAKDKLVNGKIPDEYSVDGRFITTLVIAAAVSAVLLAFGLLLLNRRKAENSNSTGKFAVSRILNSTTVFIICALMACVFLQEAIDVSSFLMIFTMMLLGVAGYFISQWIMTKNLKKACRSLVSCGIIAGVFLLTAVTLKTGCFGIYNRTPDKEDVQSVSISTNEYDLAINVPSKYRGYVLSKNPEDIETVLNLFDKIKNDNGKDDEVIGSVTFLIVDNDGKEKYRYFNIWSEDLYYEYLESVVNSDFFDAILEYNLLGFENNKSEDGNYVLIESDSYLNFSDNNDLVAITQFFDSQMIVVPDAEENDGKDEVLREDIEIYKGDALATALYNDLSKMTYKDLFQNNSKPVGILGDMNTVALDGDTIFVPDTNRLNYDYMGEEEIYTVNEEEDDVALVRSMVILYPQMTETLKYLESNGYAFENVYTGNVKEIIYADCTLNLSCAIRRYVEISGSESEIEMYYIYKGSGQTTRYFRNYEAYYNSFEYLGNFVDEKMSCLELLKKVYNDIGYPLKTVESDKTESVLNACVPEYYVYNNNGKTVFIIYDDGTIVQQYLPEENSSKIGL